MNILLALLAIVGGIIMLVWAADRFVHGAAATAHNLGISSLVIGLVIIGFGTSAPEMLVSATAALQGNPHLAVGNALGSNIANIALVLGATALVCPLVVKSDTLRREYPVMFVVMLVALFLMLDQELSALDGTILLVSLLAVMAWMIKLGLSQKRGDPITAELDKEIPRISTPLALFWLVFGLILLMISSKILVIGAVATARWFGVSDLVIGLTIIAIGTSLPELAASIMSAIKKEHDLVIGNIIGSNMFNIMAVLGISSTIATTEVSTQVLQRDYGFMLALSIALFFMAYGFRAPGRINRIEGMILLASYFIYLGVLYVTAIK